VDLRSRVRKLATTLRSRDAAERGRARRSLVSIGSPATHPLMKLLRDRSHQVRWEVAKALGEIADPEAAPALVSGLEDRDFDVRWLAAVGLIAIGRDALVPLLEELVKRPESLWLRQGAHHVLLNLTDAESAGIVAPVLLALEDVEPEVGVIEPATTAAERLKERNMLRRHPVPSKPH
jgi:HEAT repeat protein